jgi:choline dehydrogenase-like flavoprotein
MLKRPLIALIEVELEEIRLVRNSAAPLPVNPDAVADDVLRYLESISPVVRDTVSLAIDLLDVGLPPFSLRPLKDRVRFLRKERWGGLPWQGLSYALSIVWLVLYSNPELCQALGAAVLTDPPGAVPDDGVGPVATDASLEEAYDVCVIGSGAGGALVAYRLGAVGLRVLLMDSGRWVPPQELSARHDQALAKLYLQGGVQPALPDAAAVFGGHPAGINFLQANVFGGGPYVNNAIQLPITRDRLEGTWRPRGFPFDWTTISGAMAMVARDLQFGATSLDPTLVGSPHSSVRPGVRSQSIFAAVQALWPGAAANPVSVWDCVGCGACNIGCRYNRKTGGVHGPRPPGVPSSYLMRAIGQTGGCVALRSKCQAIRFDLEGKRRAASLIVRDLHDGRLHAVRAQAYVVAAGPVASSRILQETHIGRPWGAPAFGTRVAANVTTPVTCRMQTPAGTSPPRPGLQMCFYVEPETGQLLEGWFDAPAGISTATSGLPGDTAAFAGDYEHANILGVVVPIDDLASVHRGPIPIKANIEEKDFQRILRAIAHAACALYRSGAVNVAPGHRLNTNVSGPLVIDGTDALNGDVDRIVGDLARHLSGPQDLSLQTPHPQGGNPIADSPERGVVAPSFKVFGTSNIFVADASIFPAGCGRNPQLTTMGLAHLASTSIAGRIGTSDLDHIE